jgi:putative membrane protein
MEELLINNYLTLKSLHIISVICWMAGLFYLPRLFVYHTRAKVASELDLTLQIMEKKLLKIIIIPSMVLTFIFGLPLIYIIGLNSGGWLHLKVFLVLILVALNIMLVKFKKDFAQGNNKKSEKFFRMINELPPVLMILIVFLVVLKPF